MAAGCALAAAAQGKDSFTPMPLDAGFGLMDISAPAIAPEEIIRQFAARESEFQKALNHYTWRRAARVQTIDDDNKVDGEYYQVDDVLFDPTGKRFEKTVYAPQSTLQQVQMSASDLQDIQRGYPFVLTAEVIGQYNVKYVGRQKVDEVDCYVFSVSPKVIEKKMRLPVQMENAATACLLAELTFRRIDGIRDVVLLTVSEGIGTGVFANGQLITGHHGMAGEFGHASLDPSGLLCTCGQKGCWETFASCNAALRYYKELQPQSRAVAFHELLTMADNDQHAAQALARQALYIGRGLRMIIAGLAPSLILVAGDITSAWHRFGPVIEKEVADRTLAGTPPRILPTHEGEIARLRGAAALVFQRRPVRKQLQVSNRSGARQP